MSDLDEILQFLRACISDQIEQASFLRRMASSMPLGYRSLLNIAAQLDADAVSKRLLIDQHTPAEKEPETDQELHRRRAHPDWEYATTEGQRKQFVDQDVPPVDEHWKPDYTWEKNVDAGRDGWERFDYTEESYWRRRLPAGSQRREYVPEVLRFLAMGYADKDRYKPEWTVG